MPELATYPSFPHMPQKQGMGLKTKIAIGVGSAVIIGFGIRWLVKAVKQTQSNKAESKSFTEGNPETTAKQIHMAFDNDGWPGTNMVELRSIMTKVKSLEEWTKIEKAYETLYSKVLSRRIEDELQSSEFKEFLAIKGAKPIKPGIKVSGDVLYRSWAIRLKAAFEKVYGFIPGTDEKAIDVVISEIPTQRAFINVGKAYGKEYKGANILNEMKSEGVYDKNMNIILRKPQA